jgi:NADPH:quinone reductase-like Zn-dependent oxidoreductase
MRAGKVEFSIGKGLTPMGTANSRQIRVVAYGGPEVMELHPFDPVEPAPGEALVRIHFAGISRGDVLHRRGIIPGAAKPPYVPGYAFSGIVEAVGSGVHSLPPGQTVVAVVRSGAYSERIRIPADRLVAAPAGTDLAAAAAAALNYFISVQMLERIAKVRAGQTILVHGASGGTGIALLQVAQIMGVTAWGTCSRAKFALVERYGGRPIDYRSQRFEDVIRSSQPGVDAAFDPIGHFRRSYSILRKGGTMVAYGLSDSLRNGKPDRLLATKAFVGGILLPKLLPDGKRTVFYSAFDLEKSQPQAYAQDLGKVLELLAQGKIDPLLMRKFPLAQAREAETLLEQGNVTGTLVLDCDAA